MKINKYIYYFVLYVICCDINAMDAIEESQVSASSSFPKIMEGRDNIENNSSLFRNKNEEYSVKMSISKNRLSREDIVEGLEEYRDTIRQHPHLAGVGFEIFQGGYIFIHNGL